MAKKSKKSEKSAPPEAGAIIEPTVVDDVDAGAPSLPSTGDGPVLRRAFVNVYGRRNSDGSAAIKGAERPSRLVKKLLAKGGTVHVQLAPRHMWENLAPMLAAQTEAIRNRLLANCELEVPFEREVDRLTRTHRTSKGLVFEPHIAAVDAQKLSEDRAAAFESPVDVSTKKGAKALEDGTAVLAVDWTKPGVPVEVTVEQAAVLLRYDPEGYGFFFQEAGGGSVHDTPGARMTVAERLAQQNRRAPLPNAG